MNIDWVRKAKDLTPHIRDFVNGTWKSERPGKLLKKYSPRDGTLVCEFSAAGAPEANEAVAIARQAFTDGRWSKRPVQRRKDALYALASLMEKHKEELALLDCLDVGKPISDALNIDVPTAVAIIRHSAEAADKCGARVYGADQSTLSYQLQRPLGVVAAIVGWNFPLVLAASKVGPALAMGNSLVLKPSELTSLSASRLAELAVQAGVPNGVFNVIHGDAELGEALAYHHDVDLLTFTGSTATGRKLLIAAGESNMKRTILECGGKAPSIVFEDCPDMPAVANAVVGRAFWNQGEVCTATSRLLVQESIKEEFLRMVVKESERIRSGDPLRAETTFGALVSQEHKRKVLGYIKTAESEGSRVVYSSSSAHPFESGFYVSPVILDEVRPSQAVAKEEIFGPVLSVMSFRDEEEAVRIANDTIYGLSAIVWTRDLGRAHRVAHSIDVGWAVVNATGRPGGGPGSGALAVSAHKASGIGTEGGLEGLEAYASKTAVQFFV